MLAAICSGLSCIFGEPILMEKLTEYFEKKHTTPHCKKKKKITSLYIYSFCHLDRLNGHL